ncbi:MAG: twin-arginine translocase TatA/TatE family subunit [Phycisphaerales bacterium]
MILPTLAIQPPGPLEWGIILLIALLLFGRRLPEVGKSLGKGIVEFRRGLKGVTDEIEDESNKPSPPASRPSAARPPLTGGEDPRVAHGSNPEPSQSEPQRDVVGERPNGA